MARRPPIGQRVEMTPLAKHSFFAPYTGTVVGYSRDVELIRVLRDGQKCPSRWHHTFWRKERRRDG